LFGRRWFLMLPTLDYPAIAMIDDINLRQRVLDEFRWDPKFDATHVGATVADGAVTLSGHVDSYAALFAARKAARRVGGVKAIADELEVRLGAGYERDDSDIAESIARVLTSNVTLGEQDVQADVRNGIVTLMGTVEWQAHRRHVEKQVAHVSGVRTIVNQIKLRPQARIDDIAAGIKRALERNAEFEARHVTVDVDVDKSTVTLGGTVKALYERGLIEKSAWSAPGVQDVINDIRVA